MTSRPSPVSRRRLLTGGAVAGAAAVAGIGHASSAAAAATVDTGTATVAFHGTRQAGVAEDPPAHASFVAFTLAGRRFEERFSMETSDFVAPAVEPFINRCLEQVGIEQRFFICDRGGFA